MVSSVSSTSKSVSASCLALTLTEIEICGGWPVGVSERGAFVQHYGSDVLDASLLLMPLTIAQFAGQSGKGPDWLLTVTTALQHGAPALAACGIGGDRGQRLPALPGEMPRGALHLAVWRCPAHLGPGQRRRGPRRGRELAGRRGRGLPGADRKLRPHRGVTYRVFTNVLRLTARILDVEPDNPGRQLITEPAFGRIAELINRRGADRAVRGLHPAEPDFVAVLRRGAVDIEEADLLGLQIGDRGPFAQRVEVIVAQPLARAALGSGLDHRRIAAITAAIALVEHLRATRDQHRAGARRPGRRRRAPCSSSLPGRNDPPGRRQRADDPPTDTPAPRRHVPPMAARGRWAFGPFVGRLRGPCRATGVALPG